MMAPRESPSGLSRPVVPAAAGDARVDRTLQVRERARALGFDAAAITRAEPPRGAERLREWVRRSYHAGMAWMARDPEGRGDPRSLFPGARSVVVLARRYAGSDDPPLSSGHGRIARYARGRDYHRSLRKPVEELARFIESLGPWRARGFVDSAPVAEKPLAQAAGLGWIGKHTCLVSRSLGTWFFLAEVVTDAPLAPGAAASDHCGTCRRCLDACPTAALVSPYVLDAGRCIAYWTIEHRGAIPVERRSAVGDHLFGCDDCLAACPWNRFAGASAEARGALDRSVPASLEAARLLESSDEAIRARFAGTPLLRARPEGLRRNAAVVLGNVGGPEAAAVLRTVAARPGESPLVREHAAWALDRVGPR